MKQYNDLKEALTDLRIISHSWTDLDEVYETLQDVKKYLRTCVLTDELFDLYDEVSLSIIDIEDSVETVLFDGRIFTSALTRFGFEDFTRDDYCK